MTLFQLILLAIIQGVTEFLPISSSGHLALLPMLGNFPDQGQVVDVSVHVGTLGAVILYFWDDVKSALRGTPRMLTGDTSTKGAKLALMLMIATVPVVVFGAVLKVTGWSDLFRSMRVIGWTMLGFGILLWWMDQTSSKIKKTSGWTRRDAWIMGMWQAIALIPGTSRSGITITGALALGYTRKDSAHLAMLMSVPAIIASGIYLGAESAMSLRIEQIGVCILGAFMSFIAAFFALRFMMVLLNSVSFTPYVIYRVILGITLLTISYSA